MTTPALPLRLPDLSRWLRDLGRLLPLRPRTGRVSVTIAADISAFSAAMNRLQKADLAGLAAALDEASRVTRYRMRLARERQTGRAFVSAEATRVRRELGLPEVPRG